MNNANKIEDAVRTLQSALHDSGRAHLRLEIETQGVGLLDPNTGEIFVDIERQDAVDDLIANLT